MVSVIYFVCDELFSFFLSNLFSVRMLESFKWILSVFLRAFNDLISLFLFLPRDTWNDHSF